MPGLAAAVAKALLTPHVRAAMGVPPLGKAKPPPPAAKPAAAPAAGKRKAPAAPPGGKAPKIPAAPVVKKAPSLAPPGGPAGAMKAMKAMKTMKVMKVRPRLRPPAAAAHKWGDWYSAARDQSHYATAIDQVCSGDLLEFEMLDTAGGKRGYILGSIVGQTLEAGSGIPLMRFTPLAASDAEVERWMVSNLATPNALHLVKDATAKPAFAALGYHVQLVLRWRLRHRSSITEAWAAHLHAPGGALRLGAPRAGAVAPLAPPLGAPAAPQADGAMGALAGLAAGLGGPGLADGLGAPAPLIMPPLPDGGGVGGLGLPQGAAPLGFAPPLGFDAPAPGTPLANVDYEGIVRTLLKEANLVHSRTLPPTLSVREKLSARAGAVHLARLLRRAFKEHKAEDFLQAPPSDEEGWYKELEAQHKEERRSKKKDKGRSAKKKRRKKSSSSASDSSARSSRSDRPFRGASSAGSAGSRAVKEAVKRPHFVLVDTLYEIATVLPRPVGEAAPTKVTLYKTLPSLFMAYYTQVLKAALESSQSASQRDERESLTICQTLDALLGGEVLHAIMIQLGRLKAVKEARATSSGGWQVARHYELIPARDAGLTTEADRANAARDFRQHQRLTNALAGRGLAPQGKGAGRERRRQDGS